MQWFFLKNRIPWVSKCSKWIFLNKRPVWRDLQGVSKRSYKRDVSVPARQPSRAGAFLSAVQRSGGGDPPVYWQQEVGTYIYSLLYTHTGLLGRLLHEVLQPLMWRGHRWPLGPMKEASSTAICSSPSSALGLRHRLRPTVRHGRSTGRRGA